MSAILQQLREHAKKAGAAIRRSRKSEGKKPYRKSLFPSSLSSSSVIEKTDIVPTSSPWDLLPVEIQIKIFAQCGIKDLLQLKLVCKAFCQVLTLHEQLIARQYLRQARHGTLPSPIDSEREYTRNPEDDVVLLSDLFPPAKSAKGGHLYTFRYMHSLRRRAKLCSKLCYYLADRVMDRFVHCEPAFVKAMFPTRNERNEFLKRGKSSLWFNLIPLMYYTLYFLEAYSLARRELKNALLQDMEAGRLPVPIPPDVRKSMYRDLQIGILRSAPFTNTSTLICTHHCMQLLVSYLRHTVPPEEPVADDSWIGSLLTASPFLRIVEYFSAEIGDGGSQRVQRKDFMRNFHNDLMLNEKDDINSLVFESTPVSHLHSSVQDVWFDVAREELASRRAFPHDAENIWVWKGVPVALGCQDCRQGRAWRA
ncbi:F-box protein [Aspergillus fischeri NRRL 181]|uniref:F-box domain protein n=1 Tax=Neosartorya fischeri (strain ATCC 1020 / DSM 3700 / CBS 544.65 / FGSC A1164 / JCM 1740 / NRRL 181 / WB 181) TaxID=331117 RepID=A1D682_NEOFI|nr:F-box domain protein [Aspergillus fischeri NRRL 181]EAW21226.1 F-box domain protein [Aspergillus fischeri NRRL 181]